MILTRVIARTTINSMRLCGVLRLVVVGFLVLPAVVLGGSGPRRCKFPAIFNFGDSNSDTGGISAALSEFHEPNGETFFGHPSGRVCDGRLILDFIGNWANPLIAVSFYAKSSYVARG